MSEPYGPPGSLTNPPGTGDVSNLNPQPPPTPLVNPLNPSGGQYLPPTQVPVQNVNGFVVQPYQQPGYDYWNHQQEIAQTNPQFQQAFNQGSQQAAILQQQSQAQINHINYIPTSTGGHGLTEAQTQANFAARYPQLPNPVQARYTTSQGITPVYSNLPSGEGAVTYYQGNGQQFVNTPPPQIQTPFMGGVPVSPVHTLAPQNDFIGMGQNFFRTIGLGAVVDLGMQTRKNINSGQSPFMGPTVNNQPYLSGGPGMSSPSPIAPNVGLQIQTMNPYIGVFVPPSSLNVTDPNTIGSQSPGQYVINKAFDTPAMIQKGLGDIGNWIKTQGSNYGEIYPQQQLNELVGPGTAGGLIADLGHSMFDPSFKVQNPIIIPTSQEIYQSIPTPITKGFDVAVNYIRPDGAVQLGFDIAAKGINAGAAWAGLPTIDDLPGPVKTAYTVGRATIGGGFGVIPTAIRAVPPIAGGIYDIGVNLVTGGAIVGEDWRYSVKHDIPGMNKQAEIRAENWNTMVNTGINQGIIAYNPAGELIYTGPQNPSIAQENYLTGLQNISQSNTEFNKNLDNIIKNSPTEKYKQSTFGYLQNQSPTEVPYLGNTVNWRDASAATMDWMWNGVSGISKPIYENPVVTPIINAINSNPVGAGAGIFAVTMFTSTGAMARQVISETPLALDIISRDVVHKGVGAGQTFVEMGAFGTASMGRFILEDPIRGVASVVGPMVIPAILPIKFAVPKMGTGEKYLTPDSNPIMRAIWKPLDINSQRLRIFDETGIKPSGEGMNQRVRLTEVERTARNPMLYYQSPVASLKILVGKEVPFSGKVLVGRTILDKGTSTWWSPKYTYDSEIPRTLEIVKAEAHLKNMDVTINRLGSQLKTQEIKLEQIKNNPRATSYMVDAQQSVVDSLRESKGNFVDARGKWNVALNDAKNNPIEINIPRRGVTQTGDHITVPDFNTKTSYYLETETFVPKVKLEKWAPTAYSSAEMATRLSIPTQFADSVNINKNPQASFGKTWLTSDRTAWFVGTPMHLGSFLKGELGEGYIPKTADEARMIIPLKLNYLLTEGVKSKITGIPGEQYVSGYHMYDTQIRALTDLYRRGPSPEVVKDTDLTFSRMKSVKPGTAPELAEIIRGFTEYVDPKMTVAGSLSYAEQSYWSRQPKDVDVYTDYHAALGGVVGDFYIKYYGKDNVRVNIGEESTSIKIRKNPGEGFVSAFDIHSRDFGGATGGAIGRYGMPIEKPIKVDGINFMTMREQVSRKVTASTALHHTSEGSMTAPMDYWRGKDWADQMGILHSAAIDAKTIKLGTNLREGASDKLVRRYTDYENILGGAMAKDYPLTHPTRDIKGAIKESIDDYSFGTQEGITYRKGLFTNTYKPSKLSGKALPVLLDVATALVPYRVAKYYLPESRLPGETGHDRMALGKTIIEPEGLFGGVLKTRESRNVWQLEREGYGEKIDRWMGKGAVGKNEPVYSVVLKTSTKPLGDLNIKTGALRGEVLDSGYGITSWGKAEVLKQVDLSKMPTKDTGYYTPHMESGYTIPIIKNLITELKPDVILDEFGKPRLVNGKEVRAIDIYNSRLGILDETIKNYKPNTVRDPVGVLRELKWMPYGGEFELATIFKRYPDSKLGGSVGQKTFAFESADISKSDIDQYTAYHPKMGQEVYNFFVQHYGEKAVQIRIGANSTSIRILKDAEGLPVDLTGRNARIPAGAEFDKVFEAHKPSFQGGASIGRFGLMKYDPVVVEGINMMNPKEQILRKASATITMQRDINGDFTFGAITGNRGKDFADTQIGLESAILATRESYLDMFGLPNPMGTVKRAALQRDIDLITVQTESGFGLPKGIGQDYADRLVGRVTQGNTKKSPTYIENPLKPGRYINTKPLTDTLWKANKFITDVSEILPGVTKKTTVDIKNPVWDLDAVDTKVIETKMGLFGPKIVETSRYKFEGEYSRPFTGKVKALFGMDYDWNGAVFKSGKITERGLNTIGTKTIYELDPLTKKPLEDINGRPIVKFEVDEITGMKILDAKGNPIPKQVPLTQTLTRKGTTSFETGNSPNTGFEHYRLYTDDFKPDVDTAPLYSVVYGEAMKLYDLNAKPYVEGSKYSPFGRGAPRAYEYYEGVKSGYLATTGMVPQGVRSARDLMGTLETAGKLKAGSADLVIGVLRSYDHVIGGNFATELQSSRSRGKLSDVDIESKNSLDLRNSLYNVLSDQMGKDNVRIIKNTIETKNNGAWETVFDIHDTRFGEHSFIEGYQAGWGIKTHKPIVVDGLNIKTIADQAQDKLQTLSFFRRANFDVDPLTGRPYTFGEAAQGDMYFGLHKAHRGKDVEVVEYMQGYKQYLNTNNLWFLNGKKIAQIEKAQKGIENFYTPNPLTGKDYAWRAPKLASDLPAHLAGRARLAEYGDNTVFPSEHRMPLTNTYFSDKPIFAGFDWAEAQAGKYMPPINTGGHVLWGPFFVVGEKGVVRNVKIPPEELVVFGDMLKNKNEIAVNIKNGKVIDKRIGDSTSVDVPGQEQFVKNPDYFKEITKIHSHAETESGILNIPSLDDIGNSMLFGPKKDIIFQTKTQTAIVTTLSDSFRALSKDEKIGVIKTTLGPEIDVFEAQSRSKFKPYANKNVPIEVLERATTVSDLYTQTRFMDLLSEKNIASFDIVKIDLSKGYGVSEKFDSTRFISGQIGELDRLYKKFTLQNENIDKSLSKTKPSEYPKINLGSDSALLLNYPTIGKATTTAYPTIEYPTGFDSEYTAAFQNVANYSVSNYTTGGYKKTGYTKPDYTMLDYTPALEYPKGEYAPSYTALDYTPALEYPKSDYPGFEYPKGNYPGFDYTGVNYPPTDYPLPKYPTPEYPIPKYPTPEYPIPEYPVPNYPTTEYPFPEYPTPKYPTPEYPIPEYPFPEYPMPKYPTPEYPTPKYPTPEYPIPEYPTPKYPTPEYPIPEYPFPEYPTPKYPTPEYPTPKYPTPEYPVPEYPFPEYPIPKYPPPEYPIPEYPVPNYPPPYYPPPNYPPPYFPPPPEYPPPPNTPPPEFPPPPELPPFPVFPFPTVFWKPKRKQKGNHFTDIPMHPFNEFAPLGDLTLDMWGEVARLPRQKDEIRESELELKRDLLSFNFVEKAPLGGPTGWMFKKFMG